MKLLPALVRVALLATLPLTANLAAAHGDPHKAKAGAIKKEQKDWGIAGEAKAAKRTIEFRMSDAMRFSRDSFEVRQGETLRLVLRNDGKLLHEFVIGNKTELDQHAALMLKFPTMEHDEPYMAHGAPGKAGAVVWTFNRAGDFHFACLIAGHYSAGMVGRIKVAAR